MSEFDKQNLEKILDGLGDWFTAILLRAIYNYSSIRNAVRTAFPEEVAAVETLIVLDALSDAPTYYPFRGAPIRATESRYIEILGMKADFTNYRKLVSCGLLMPARHSEPCF